MAYRTGLKQFHCLTNVSCGENITATHINRLRDLGQAAFETERNVVSVFAGTIDSCVQNAIGGYCWNMIKGYDGDPNTQIKYQSEPNTRYQLAFPHIHKMCTLYVGGQAPAMPTPGVRMGTYIDDNGIQGNQIKLGQNFENKGENRIVIRATYKRGQRYVSGARITDNSSDTSIYELNTDNTNPIVYKQHVQCWYCRPNPIIGNPPLKILLFNDSDTPFGIITDIKKTIDISSLVPIAGTSEEHYIVLATWFEVPYIQQSSGLPIVPVYTQDHDFVFNTTWNEADAKNPDGLISFSANIYKQC